MRDKEGGFYAAEDADSPSPTDPSVTKEGKIHRDMHTYIDR